ncbi:NAD(P)/FAD-dependent oxidoreductase [Siccirubricoccus sp. KC 17139]|uniref:NAD(P)/FAD-dependent oxidoreductase n=1 Tax=Siccirubricoccus soli TaxID=2899147 RepID=A0ABT1D2E0_9PROT|nr:NAD(P)/FAD-dependent oxidoreductase [Siccirubricoccus soli]MCO6416093.1 NAD(P)/FAD-dependent oxidoreductase [Siccirubricoccus soli]MCP2682225.1 NAD(P)/FAD-dependent oxidoreductase [Siccirubricoccus soli]
MPDAYDLVVLGSGTAAQVASSRVRAAGWTVAVVDHRPFGGTCALRGCDPKKMLVSGEEALDAVRRMRGHGVEGDVRIAWPDLMAFKRSFTDPVPQKQEKRYCDQGIDAFHGLARFTGPDTVTVEGRELKARHVLIATGARPVPLGVPGEEHVATSDDFLELESLPARVAFIGGGYVAAEFSHLAARAGAEVTVLQRGARMLPKFDPDLVGWLMERFDELGVDVRTGAAVNRVEKTGQGFLVHAVADGREQTVAADLVVHAAGRVPDLDALDLAAGGVALEGRRLRLNEFLQSVSNPRVYAAGDAAGSGPPLTPVSSHDAKVVAANLLEGNHARPDYRGVPSVAFTVPPITTVGLGEAEARERGLRFRVKSARVPQWFTARRLAERIYGYKTLVEEDTGRILGAHLVGPHADEVINLFALAIRHGLTAADLKGTMFAYPTGASDIGYMA